MQRVDDSNKKKYTWYTDITNIHKEMDERFNNKKLYQQILNLWGKDIPSFINDDKKYAVMSRTIFTPNTELFYFFDLCSLLDLTPLLLEYPVGKFVARNQEKYNLAKLSFFNGYGKKGGIKIEYISIVNFNVEEGKKMNEVETIFDKKLIDFHHEVLDLIHKNIIKNIVDFSEWFDKTKIKDQGYYFYFLSLFMRNAVLFENFIDSDNEEVKFTTKKFEPSFDKICDFFGFKPLIFPLLPFENEKSESWHHYKDSMKSIFFDKIKK